MDDFQSKLLVLHEIDFHAKKLSCLCVRMCVSNMLSLFLSPSLPLPIFLLPPKILHQMPAVFQVSVVFASVESCFLEDRDENEQEFRLWNS